MSEQEPGPCPHPVVVLFYGLHCTCCGARFASVSELEPDRVPIMEAYVAYVTTHKTVRETPGSDHEREIQSIAFREGWLAAMRAGLTGDKSE